MTEEDNKYEDRLQPPIESEFLNKSSKAVMVHEPSKEPSMIVVPTFDSILAVKVVELIANGNSYPEACKEVNLTMLQFYIWRRQIPSFNEAINQAKVSRAEWLTEKLLEKAKDELEKAKVDPKMFGVVYKIIERITSLHDPAQNSRIMVEAQIHRESLVVENPFAKVPEKDISSFSLDEKDEDD